MRQILIKRSQNIALIVGITMLISAALMLLSMLTGVVNTPEQFIAGESTVHSVARVAISGCLLAALGSLE